jgi:hypothetical protein
MLRRVMLLALATPSLLACNGKATPADCGAMIDHYLDMTIAADPELANLPPDEAKAAREMKKTLRKAEPSYKKVEDQCEAEITKREVRCAMKAVTPETWQACID